jgi:hypothetical protein
MAFFYPPTPPSQGSASYAPPIPHEPQPSTGDQPPLRQVQATLAMVAVLAAWPTSLEPRLQAPNNQQNKIAPLTLVYGQQPPPRQTYRLATTNWAPDTWPAQKPPINAAVIPPPTGASTFLPAVRLPGSLLSAWYDAIDIEVVTTWTIAPDNPDQPPVVGPTTPTEIAIQRAWTQDWPAQHAPTLIATFRTGDLPPPVRQSLVGSWPLGWAQPQALISLVQPSSGDQPSPQGPLSASELAQIWLTWPQTWSAQSRPIAVVQTTASAPSIGPLTSTDRAIVQAWPIGWSQPQRLTTLVQPLTGDPPPIQGPLSVTDLAIQRSWLTDWPAQSPPKLAAWFVPPPVNQPTPIGPMGEINLFLTIGTWPTSWAAQSRPIVVVQPSTGNSPGPQGPATAAELSELVNAWPTAWPAQARPVVVVQGQGAPPSIGPLSASDISEIVGSWPTAWAAQRRPIAVIQPSPGTPPAPSSFLSVTETIVLVSQWAQAWPAQHAPTMIATLPTGTAPAPAMPLRGANLSTIMLQWQPNWSAQSVKPRRNDSAIVHFKPEWAANSNQLLGPSKSQPETH